MGIPKQSKGKEAETEAVVDGEAKSKKKDKKVREFPLLMVDGQMSGWLRWVG